jgi:hypothetical protein
VIQLDCITTNPYHTSSRRLQRHHYTITQAKRKPLHTTRKHHQNAPLNPQRPLHNLRPRRRRKHPYASPSFPPLPKTTRLTLPLDHHSTIRTAWRKVSAAPDTAAPLSLTTSPDTYYAHSKACSVKSGRSGSESGASEASLKEGGSLGRLVRLVKGE